MHWCCSLVVGVKQTAPQNVVFVCHKIYAHMIADALIFAKKTRINESLYQKEIVKVMMRKKIKTRNHSSRKKVLIVGFQILKHKINAKDSPFLSNI